MHKSVDFKNWLVYYIKGCPKRGTIKQKQLLLSLGLTLVILNDRIIKRRKSARKNLWKLNNDESVKRIKKQKIMSNSNYKI